MKKNYLIIALVLLLSGAALLYVQSAYCEYPSLWYSITGNAASALLICGIFNLLQEIFVKRDEYKNLLELFHLSTSISKAGLDEIMADSRDYNFKSIVEQSTEFIAIMCDGYTWLVHNDYELKKRFDLNRSKTEIILMDPNGNGCDYMTTKTEADYNIKLKIKNTIKSLENLYQESSKQGELIIRLTKSTPSQAVFFADQKVIITLYPNGPYMQTTPLLSFKKSSDKQNIGLFFEEDLNHVKANSTIYFDSNQVPSSWKECACDPSR